MKKLRRRLADHVKKIQQKACRTCSTIFFIQPDSRVLIDKLGNFRPQPILRDKLISFQTGKLVGCFFGLLGIGPETQRGQLYPNFFSSEQLGINCFKVNSNKATRHTLTVLVIQL